MNRYSLIWLLCTAVVCVVGDGLYPHKVWDVLNFGVLCAVWTDAYLAWNENDEEDEDCP